MTKDEFHLLLDKAKESFDDYSRIQDSDIKLGSDNLNCLICLEKALTLLDTAREGVYKIIDDKFFKEINKKGEQK